MKCINCANEIKDYSTKCPFCNKKNNKSKFVSESKTQSNMLYCPKCGYKQKVSTNKHLKWFFINLIKAS